MKDDLCVVEVIGSNFIYVGKGEYTDTPNLILKNVLPIPIKIITDHMEEYYKNSHEIESLSGYAKTLYDPERKSILKKELILPEPRIFHE